MDRALHSGHPIGVVGACWVQTPTLKPIHMNYARELSPCSSIGTDNITGFDVHEDILFLFVFRRDFHDVDVLTLLALN
jgi:hypothetical protein